MLKSGNVFKLGKNMLSNGAVMKFKSDNQQFILLGLNFYDDRCLESDLELIKHIRWFYPEIKDKDTFLYWVVFFSCVFDFIPYNEFKSDKPITQVTHYRLHDMMKQKVKVLKNEDINLYLMKNSLVDVNFKGYLEFNIAEILKSKKELEPYINTALNTVYKY